MTQSGRSQDKTNLVFGSEKIAKFVVALLSILWASGIGAQSVFGNRTFSELKADEKQNCAVMLGKIFIEDELPQNYRRHRSLQIDTNALRMELHRNWTADEDSTGADGVPVPLFENLTVLLEVRSWIDQEPDMVGVFGTVSGHEHPTSDFELYIAKDGKLQMSIRLEDAAFLITQVQGSECYLIQEFDRETGPID